MKARLEDIFAEVRKKLKSAKYDQRLPEGIILTGGGAKMRDIDLFAKEALEAAVKIGIPVALGGVSESIAKPEFAVAVGLALIAAESGDMVVTPGKKSKKTSKKSGGTGSASGSNPFSLIKKIFSKF